LTDGISNDDYAWDLTLFVTGRRVDSEDGGHSKKNFREDEGE